jgi:hypothetical protein
MALKISDIKKKFKVDTKAKILDSKNITVADMRVKAVRAIDRHIDKYIDHKDVSGRVTRLSRNTDDPDLVACHLVYGNTRIDIDGNESVVIGREEEKAFFEYIKKEITAGSMDDTLRAASIAASARLTSSRNKRK